MHLGNLRTLGCFAIASVLALAGCSSNNSSNTSAPQSKTVGPVGHRYVQNTGKSLAHAPASTVALPVTKAEEIKAQRYVQNTQKSLARAAAGVAASPATAFPTGERYIQNTGKSLASAATNAANEKKTFLFPRIPSLWGVKTKTNLHPVD